MWSYDRSQNSLKTRCYPARPQALFIHDPIYSSVLFPTYELFLQATRQLPDSSHTPSRARSYI